MSIISYEQFSQVHLRLGTITKVESFPRANKPTYKIWADFGPEIGVLQTSAQVTHHYTPEQLINKSIMGCTNLGEKNIAGFKSQFLLLGLRDENNQICLVGPEPHHNINNGQLLE